MQIDASIAIILGGLAIFAIVNLGQLWDAKANTRVPGQKAGWTGLYETKLPVRVSMKKGKTLPPPPNPSDDAKKGREWELIEAHGEPWWVGVVLAMSLGGVYCYSQGVDLSGLVNTVLDQVTTAQQQPSTLTPPRNVTVQPPPLRVVVPPRHGHAPRPHHH
jgi:hypothetical protein